MSAPDTRAAGPAQPTQWPLPPAGGAATPAPAESPVVAELAGRFPDLSLAEQTTADGIPTVWVPQDRLADVLRYLKSEAAEPFAMLYDLTAIDERLRRYGHGLPAADFTIVYHLLSYERNDDVRLKVALTGEAPHITSITDLWPAANWYEREVWDMFGIDVRRPPAPAAHPDAAVVGRAPAAQRPPGPAHRDGPFHHARRAGSEAEQDDLAFRPEEWGLPREAGRPRLHVPQPRAAAPRHARRRSASSSDCDGEEIVDCVPDIGYHHRGAEKMAERQTWHTFIPYTDRIDYLGGVINNLAYVLCRREAGRHRGAGARAGDPRDAVRALPHRQPPRLVRHLRPGRGRALAGLLHVRRTASGSSTS